MQRICRNGCRRKIVLEKSKAASPRGMFESLHAFHNEIYADNSKRVKDKDQLSAGNSEQHPTEH
jgi:hypothetical protein